ncbi:MAG: type I DNA topoisomerase [Proteobacteria bacterium]|nr:type I DNA topoisomerase [Pseudomonadota bacterium]MBU1738923.1 type I DNA topoisomerase [Pseudomonadota bacterium]
MSKSLIIVESPAKARTLQKYLGKSFTVKASVGHIRDLPTNSLGVDVENDFEPKYVTIRGKSKIINELKSAASKADEIFLAPDPDREGEAIAYHIAESLKKTNKPIHRALFHELTKKAILNAIENSTELNYKLFEAQQARRILDRLVGYQISPLLWEKVRRGLSAGRVQSVAVRMICERDQAIRDFKPEEYWTISTRFEGALPPPFLTQLDSFDGKKITAKKNRIENQARADEICQYIKGAEFKVGTVDKKRKKRHPSPPFITSSMQMDANRKLRFSAKKTMTLAQKLYEGIELGAEGPTGLITYMRTDSTRISDDAITGAREYIAGAFGADFLPDTPNIYKTKKSAQDAHEAIRPTNVDHTPEKMAGFLDKDMLALYALIWKRFVACQMAPAEFDQTTISVNSERCTLKATGSVMRFLGFMKLYVEATDDNPASDKGENSDPDTDLLLPDLQENEPLTLMETIPAQHFTQPPPYYTEATLVKALEDNGVGRPSTYAAIISTIQDKEYVLLAKRRFEPTDLGRLVNDLLVTHFPTILDVEFTAGMEKQLDQVEDGSRKWLTLLQDFYGPFRETLETARQEMKSVKKATIPTDIPCELCEGKMVIRWGRNGEFLACENFPTCKHTQDFTKDENNTVIPVAKPEPEKSDEICEKCGKPMVFKQGRYGTFLACSGYPECRFIKAQSTGVKCPEENCSGEIVQKVSKKGKVFYSCDRYPKCSFAVWDKPVAEQCPDCGAPFLVEKITRKDGATIKCYQKTCKYSRPLE